MAGRRYPAALHDHRSGADLQRLCNCFHAVAQRIPFYPRAQLSSLGGALFLSLGLGAPVIGWLLDRWTPSWSRSREHRFAPQAFVLAGRSTLLGALYHLFMGVGVAAAVLTTLRGRQLVRCPQGPGTGRGVHRTRAGPDEHIMRLANRLLSGVWMARRLFLLTHSDAGHCAAAATGVYTQPPAVGSR